MQIKSSAELQQLTNDPVRQQFDTGRGPSLEAARHRRTIRAEVGGQRDRWPEFDEQARRIGVRTYLSMPLLDGIADGDELIGSLNVYSWTASAFDSYDEGLLGLYTVAAGQNIVNARHWRQTRETVAQLEQALITRAEIDQAKGALMAVHGFTAEQAFARLSEQSQRENIKVHTLARQLLESLQNKRPGP